MAKAKITESQRMKKILDCLEKHYPEVKTSLAFKSPFELLVATILSAQCTDERVNKVTPVLFRRLPGPRQMAAAPLSLIEKLIHSCGFYKNKAASIKSASKSIVEDYGGEVPSTIDELVKLRGVGRKTANVVLGNAFGVPGIAVDTHVGRLCRRLGFSASFDPVEVEKAMMLVVEKKRWIEFAHLLIAHGRKICTSRKAYCDRCPVADLCPKILS